MLTKEFLDKKESHRYFVVYMICQIITQIVYIFNLNPGVHLNSVLQDFMKVRALCVDNSNFNAYRCRFKEDYWFAFIMMNLVIK